VIGHRVMIGSLSQGSPVATTYLECCRYKTSFSGLWGIGLHVGGVMTNECNATQFGLCSPHI
jgi:hypothetical protein